jgi:hypothetical protein
MRNVFTMVTAEQRAAALATADPLLNQKGYKPTVMLQPNKIKTMPELFQPRSPTYGGKRTDERHVKKLKQALDIYGEIDRMTVIKLTRKGFVVVDGHHSLEAYKLAGKGNQQVECDWFPGISWRVAWRFIFDGESSSRLSEA